ncbi:uncharacterized protein DUF3816 [Mycoplasma testudineum]|uniref:Uncharacterized protein DUF3816 n=1 Tax=Mycoplasma testudineum TaxID=244584 RepID=A0A4R6ID60_9MOLU|nr:ECF transporter S component [Mycoplasma testudineum]OYD26713.1 hypothetical protein CG473_02845 [Mycoplasma testudineum]TDO19844.1 uncharacterized protein DUF3816 [Mycoplasma testudineum]
MKSSLKNLSLKFIYFKKWIIQNVFKLDPDKYESKSRKIHRLSLLTIYISLIFLLSFIPNTGYIQVFIFNITILPVFMVIAAVHLGWSGGSIIGLTIGIGSFLRAYIYGDATNMFYFPDISILPRFLTGFILGGLISKIIPVIKKQNIRTIAFIIFAILAPLLNTMFVTSLIYLHNSIWPFPFMNGRSLIVWLGLIYINFIVEISVAFAIAVLFVSAAFQLGKRYENTITILN